MEYDPDQVVSVYVHSFANRTDVYSRWTPDGWRPVREPLTTAVAVAGLTGTGPAISAYMIGPGSLAHTLALDFDTDNGLDQAMLLGRTMWAQGLPAYVETSRRGAHLWCIISATLTAASIRKAARALLATALLPTDDPHIEVRPGSDTVSETGLGHALRLPMMPHPKTGIRGVMFDPQGHRLGPSLAAVMLDIEHAPSVEVLKWADRWNPAVEMLPSSLKNPKPPREDDGTSASELLMTLWGVPIAEPGKNVHCPVHGQDRKPSLTIMKDDRRVICRVPGCLLNNLDKGRGTWELRTMAPHG